MEKIDITHPAERYENIFNAYALENENGNKYAFYNILNKISIPDDVEASVFDYYSIPSYMPLTTLSQRIYQTMYLWWLIVVVNKIQNPVKLIAPGSVIKVIKPEYIDSILGSLQQK